MRGPERCRTPGHLVHPDAPHHVVQRNPPPLKSRSPRALPTLYSKDYTRAPPHLHLQLYTAPSSPSMSTEASLSLESTTTSLGGTNAASI